MTALHDLAYTRQAQGDLNEAEQQNRRCDMPTPTHDLVGRELHDTDNHSVGKITALYQYPVELNAPWGAAAVTHGLIRRTTHLVDLEKADIDGDTVQVPHTSHTITTAPNHRPLLGDTLADHHAVDVRAHYWGAAQPA